MAAAKDAVYTIFPGEEFVPFLSKLQLEKIEFLPACSLFPCPWAGKVPTLDLPTPRDVSTLRNNSRPFMI